MEQDVMRHSDLLLWIQSVYIFLGPPGKLKQIFWCYINSFGRWSEGLTRESKSKTSIKQEWFFWHLVKTDITAVAQCR